MSAGTKSADGHMFLGRGEGTNKEWGREKTNGGLGREGISPSPLPSANFLRHYKGFRGQKEGRASADRTAAEMQKANAE